MSSRILTLGLPSGSLMEATINLFAKAGFSVSGSTRSYRPAIDDPELEIRCCVPRRLVAMSNTDISMRESPAAIGWRKMNQTCTR